jgi:Alpha/beta hydrolase family
MAEDNAAFLCALDFAPAHLVGWSDGAAVGLLTAWRYRELVRKLVYIGQNMTRDGMRPQYQAMGELSVEQLPPMYAAVSPDGAEHFKVVFERLKSSWTSDLALPVERLGEVSTPTLVMMGDDDIPSVEHADDIRNRLADPQLAIVPGTSHALPMEKPDVVKCLVALSAAALCPVSLQVSGEEILGTGGPLIGDLHSLHRWDYSPEGWWRTNRRLLPHPISHWSYCPSAPSPPQDQPHMARAHTCSSKPSTGGTSYQSRQPRASHVEQHRGVWYGLSVDGRWQLLVGPWPVPTGSPRAVLDVEEPHGLKGGGGPDRPRTHYQ